MLKRINYQNTDSGYLRHEFTGYCYFFAYLRDRQGDFKLRIKSVCNKPDSLIDFVFDDFSILPDELLLILKEKK